jgi:Ca-activated chloride channel homolog
VLLPFELRRSDLPLQIAFPILVANSVDWLAPPQGLNVPTSVKPGEVVALPEGSLVQPTNQQAITVDKRGFAQTEQPGIYRFRVTNNNNEVNGAFAVNFFNPIESAIAPNPQQQVGSGVGATNTQTQLSQREFWGLLAALALLVLMAEWWVYQRGLPARLQARQR